MYYIGLICTIESQEKSLLGKPKLHITEQAFQVQTLFIERFHGTDHQYVFSEFVIAWYSQLTQSIITAVPVSKAIALSGVNTHPSLQRI